MFKNNTETNSYKGWLNSDNFVKRAVAVVGYSTVGTLILYVVIGIPLFLLFLLFVVAQAV